MGLTIFHTLGLKRYTHLVTGQVISLPLYHVVFVILQMEGRSRECLTYYKGVELVKNFSADQN